METKKLTKKQREQLEADLRYKRRKFVEAVRGYWKDCEAAKRYLQTKGEKLTDKEEERLFRKYDELKDYKRTYKDDEEVAHVWSIIRTIVDTVESSHRYNDERDKYLTTKLDKDDLLVDDILWGVEDTRFLLKEARKYGFKRIFYTDNSTAAMRGLGTLIEFGAKVEGSLYNSNYDRFGLILNIEDVKFDRGLIEDPVVVEDIKKQLRTLEDGVKYEYRRRDIKNNILNTYSRHYGIIKTYETYYSILCEVAKEFDKDDSKDNNK